MPALVEPITAPELPVVEPAHDGIEPLDIGTVISGLRPALSISVEPSGIVPPFNVKFEFVVVDESDEAVPLDIALLADALVDAQAEVMVELNPPPSKTDPATGIEAIPDPLNPAIPEFEDSVVLQFETGGGLKPPGSISVAPSGIPVGLFDPAGALEPSTPSGDVTPRPAGVIALCARAAPQPNRTAAAMRGVILIEGLHCYG
jgi:hypothetical protein